MSPRRAWRTCTSDICGMYSMLTIPTAAADAFTTPRTHAPAPGIRNTVGFDFHPDTGQLVFTDNGRDGE